MRWPDFGLAGERRNGMAVSDSAVLQVLIGLAGVFAVFSLAVSRANEAVLGVMRYRATRLESELRRLTSSTTPASPTGAPDAVAAPLTTLRDLASELLDGPLLGLRAGGAPTLPNVAETPRVGGAIGAMRRARRLQLPAYLPSTAFARGVLDLLQPPVRALLPQASPDALVDVIPDGYDRESHLKAYRAAYDALTSDTAKSLEDAIPTACAAGRAVAGAIRDQLPPVGAESTASARSYMPLGAEIARLPDSPLRTALTGIVSRVGTDADKLVGELATWYDTAMDRLSGAYKRRISVYLIGYAMLFTVAFNLDAIGLSKALWQDSAVRAAAVAAATAQPQPQGGEGVVQTVRDIGALQLPFGWTTPKAAAASDPRSLPRSGGSWALKVLGWVIATAALAFGAPFWFDLLGRLVNMRATGPKPDPVGLG
jgi:hypothetical protein